jgi:hypothetical protein
LGAVYSDALQRQKDPLSANSGSNACCLVNHNQHQYVCRRLSQPKGIFVMHVIRIGKLYHPDVRHWPEGGEYNYRNGAHELLLRFNRPTAMEVEDVRCSECEFALASVDEILFFLYRFGRTVPWSDAPYTWHLLPLGQRILPPVSHTKETRALLQIILVDAGTGIVRALRGITLSPDFTYSLHTAIQNQIKVPWVGGPEYDRQLAMAYRRYRISADMLDIVADRTNGRE